MSSLLAALGAPSLNAALVLAGKAASAVATPFAQALQAAAEQCSSAASGEAASNEADSLPTADDLRESLAEKLGRILDAAGAMPGSVVELCIGPDGVDATGDPLAVGAVQRAIDSSPELVEQLWELVQQDDRIADDGSAEILSVEAAFQGRPAELQWQS